MTREELDHIIALNVTDYVKQYYELTPTIKGLIKHRIINALQGQELTVKGNNLISPSVEEISPL